MERLKSMVEEALNLWHASRNKLLETVGEYPIPDEFWDLQAVLYDIEEELRRLSYTTNIINKSNTRHKSFREV